MFKVRSKVRSKARSKVEAKVKLKSNVRAVKVKPPRARVFDFHAGSMQQQTTFLSSLYVPTLYYTEKVWAQLRYIIDTCPQEVGWVGMVESEGILDYIVTEIFLLEQEVSGVTTEIGEDAMTKLAMKLIDEGKDTSKLIYWGHSHVNMGVAPSVQDEAQVDEYIEHCPIFFRGIYNKQRESKVDMFDTESNCVHQCIDNGIVIHALSAAEEKEMEALIKSNVKEKPVSRYLGGVDHTQVCQQHNHRYTPAVIPPTFQHYPSDIRDEDISDPFYFQE